MLSIGESYKRVTSLRIRLAAILGAAICQHADDAHVVLVEEWQDAIIEQVGAVIGVFVV